MLNGFGENMKVENMLQKLKKQLLQNCPLVCGSVAVLALLMVVSITPFGAGTGNATLKSALDMVSVQQAWANEAPAAAPAAPAVAAAAPAAKAEAGKPGEKAPEGWQPIAPPKLELKDYPVVKGFNSRITVWFIAQLHLFFGAFVLAVPIFVWLIEIAGYTTKDIRYDHMAHELLKVAMTGFSIAASFGGLLTMALIVFYPQLMGYLASIFGKVMIYYALAFFVESFFLYTYYYGWDKMTDGNSKRIHIGLGLGLNLAGIFLMMVSNSWASFMMAPSGIDDAGVFKGDVWAAMNGHLWNPINIHRFVANIAYGGSVCGAYSAYKFLTAKTPQEKAHYDWMGYTAFFIAIIGLIPLPFAGYWLTKEIYDYSQQMGITLMGGAFAWLFILQAVLIGAIFLSANYYLWCSLGRSEGSKRYTFMIKPMGIVIVGAFLAWFTPHTLVMNSKELIQIGGAHHPLLGKLGVMAAKNTAVNLLLITTFAGFQIFKRSSIAAKGDGFWAQNGTYVQIGLYAAAISNVLFLGIYSYYLPASVRIGLSVPQVCTTLTVLFVSSIIDMKIFKEKQTVGEVQWGNMPVRSQYALFTLTIGFTWLMGLMGYVRSAIRQHWHVYTVMRDNSADAFTPTLPYAATVVTCIVIIFIALVLFMFWMPELASKKKTSGNH